MASSLPPHHRAARRRRQSSALPVERVESRLLLSVAHPAVHKAAVATRPAAAHVAGHAAKAVTGKKAIAAQTLKVGVVRAGGPYSAAAVTAGGNALDATTPDAAATGPFNPGQLRQFYGVNAIKFGSVAGTGAGQTIAVIDADSQPDIKTDLTTFDNQFGLQAPPSFTVESETGSTTSLPTTYDANAALETALDVEWAHAMAPAANILLILCNSLSDTDLFTNGVALADRTAGVTEVSMSFGGSESSSETGYDKYFTTPGITYVASAGDGGAADTGYPATSPDVVSVGGTSITTSDTSADYGSETVWNNQVGATGGGISSVESKPAYQSGVIQSTNRRTVADVSFDADPQTGVLVYDLSQSNGTGSFYGVGGTSLSAPCWAGLFAVANQGRVAAGLTSLSGATQTLPRLYQLASTDFHDVTTGSNNGYSAGVGYDLPTGLGTPIASKLIPDLAGDATVTGRVFQDNNADGAFDGTDAAIPALAGQTVYLDLNNNGVRDTAGVRAEPTATVSSTGTFTFSSLVTGGDLVGGLTGTVRLLNGTPAGYALVGAGSTYATAYATAATANVGLFPTAIADATAGDAIIVRTSPTASTTLQVLINGTVAYTAPVALPPSLTFTLTGAGDSLAVDFGNGDPVPAGGLGVNGTAAADGDTLSVLGTAGDDAVTVNAAAVVFGSSTITYANVPNLSVDPRGGTDSLTVNAGTVTIPAQAAGAGYLARTFSNLTVAAGARVALASAAAAADRTAVVLTGAAALSVAPTAQLDLGANDLVVRAGSLSAVSALVGSGFAGGAWTGNGIASSAAAAAAHATALAAVLGSAAAVASVDGVALGSADVLVRYTYYGDANADGVVNAADYIRTDTGFVTRLTGWANGDFNYDGTVDGSDYSLIDNAFDTQSGPI